MRLLVSLTLDLFLMDFFEFIQELCKTLCGHVQGCATRRAASSARMSFRFKLLKFQSKIETKSPIKGKYLVYVMFRKVLERGIIC